MLVVDDSAVVRRFLSTVIAQHEGVNVETAADPLIAMRKMKRQRPDVILLDIEMPRMDGLTFLRRIMEEDPIPVVICSGLAGRGTRIAIEALRQGAVEIVPKPRHGVRDFLEESAVMLIDTIRAASQAKLAHRTAQPEAVSPPLSADAVLPRSHLANRPDRSAPLIALGASTGGPEALRLVLSAMPRAAPGIVAVQHMPETFTAVFAESLNQACAIEVKEAEEGDRVTAGRALIAPGDRHLTVVRDGRGHAVRLIDGPLVSRHRPSVDVLFRSVAQSVGRYALGVIMTGMGTDGVQGLLEMRQAGAVTIAQDEASCVVFGMPKEAIAQQAVGHVVPLRRIPVFLLKHPPFRDAGPEYPPVPTAADASSGR